MQCQKNIYLKFERGGGFCKTKKFKELHKTNWNFQMGEYSKKKSLVREGGDMDIFWNYTIVAGLETTKNNTQNNYYDKHKRYAV